MVISFGLFGDVDQSAFTDEKIAKFYNITGAVVVFGLLIGCTFWNLGATKIVMKSYNDDVELETSLLLEERNEWEGNRVSLWKFSESEESIAFKSNVRKNIHRHRRVLFFSIFASILQGSFFSTVPQGQGSTINLPQALYFTRLFSDLGGRLLCFLPRPKFINSIEALEVMTGIRICLLVAFFLYISPIELPKNDIAIIILAAFCALQSGFNAVVCYELATTATSDEFGGTNRSKGISTRSLNMSFHYACFAACVMNIIIVLYLM